MSTSTVPVSSSEEDTQNISVTDSSSFENELEASAETYIGTCCNKKNFVATFKKIGENIGGMIGEKSGEKIWDEFSKINSKMKSKMQRMNSKTEKKSFRRIFWRH
jgi:hypothetical protein